MSNFLIKDITISGYFGNPGDPGTPSTPDHTYTVCRTYTPWEIVTITDPETGQTRQIQRPGAPVTVCETRTIEGSDGTPPTAPTQDDLNSQYNIGWTASGRSIEQLDVGEDGRFQFEVVPGSTGIVAGLTNEVHTDSYTDIQYGIYVSERRAVVVENGIIMTAATPHAEGDVFTVERAGRTVSYWKNSTHLYTSLVPADGILFADASLYRGGDAIQDAEFVENAILLDREGGAETSFEPLEVFSSETDYAESHASFEALTTEVSMRLWQGAAVEFEELEVFSANKVYGESRAEFQPLESEARSINELTPSLAIAGTAFMPFIGFGHGLTGTVGGVEGELEPLEVFSAEGPYGEARTSFEPLEVFALTPEPIQGWAAMELSGFSMRATAQSVAPNSFIGTMPMSFVAYGGGQARMTMSSPEFISTGEGVVMGRARLEPDSFSVEASGLCGVIGSADLEMSDFTVRAFSGAVVEVTLQDGFTLEIEGTSGVVGSASMRMPLFEIEAEGTVNGLNSAYLTMPMLQPTPSGVARLGLARFRMVAVGTAVVTLTNDSYEAYAVNLMHRKLAHNEEVVHEVTRYTNFPFEQIVRYRDKYYGVASDGLYLLEGDDDVGDPIQWHFDTCVTDFKTHNHKTTGSVYMSGVVESGLTVTVTTDQRTSYTYDYTTPRDGFPQNHRQRFGKGLKATYYSFGFSDDEGRNFRLNNAEFEVFTMKRAV